MSRRLIRFALPVAFILALGIASLAVAATQGHGKKGHNGKPSSDPNTFTATLSGHNEVPVVHTKGTGSLTLTVDPVAKTMTFTLTYSGLNNPAMAAHVHLGQPNVNGGVVFFFCGGPTTGPPPKPACPAGTTTPATVTGTVNAGDILAPMNQGLTAGDFDGIVEEMRAGFTYANVHTSSSPGGEIRGQLSSNGGRHHDDDDDDNGS